MNKDSNPYRCDGWARWLNPKAEFGAQTLDCLLLLALIGWSMNACAGDAFTPLFNGRDLTGWMPVNVASNTFTVRDGVIVSTGKPTGVMRTERHY
jgi:hypothetical protein